MEYRNKTSNESQSNIETLDLVQECHQATLQHGEMIFTRHCMPKKFSYVSRRFAFWCRFNPEISLISHV